MGVVDTFFMKHHFYLKEWTDRGTKPVYMKEWMSYFSGKRQMKGQLVKPLTLTLSEDQI